MPTRRAAAAAPRIILQRHTVRLASKSAGKLGFLVQSVADGEDIYELAERRARSEARGRRLLAQREAREREQQQQKQLSLKQQEQPQKNSD